MGDARPRKAFIVGWYWECAANPAKPKPYPNPKGKMPSAKEWRGPVDSETLREVNRRRGYPE